MVSTFPLTTWKTASHSESTTRELSVYDRFRKAFAATWINTDGTTVSFTFVVDSPDADMDDEYSGSTLYAISPNNVDNFLENHPDAYPGVSEFGSQTVYKP